MNLLKRLFLFLAIGSLCVSCATILNTKTVAVNIHTTEPSTVVLNGDTANDFGLQHCFVVPRSKKPLTVLAYNNTLRKSVRVNARNSLAFWLNAYPVTYFTGFLVDLKNPKRYTYPRNVRVNYNSPDSVFPVRRPVILNEFQKKRNILKANPFRIIDLSNPGLEIAYERKLSPTFSTQINYIHLLTDGYSKTGGFSAGIEQKIFLRRSAPVGFYTSVGFSYLKKRSREDLQYEHEEVITPDSSVFTSYSDKVSMFKQTYTLSFKVGYQFVIKRLAIDIYAGLGIRSKDVIISGQSNPKDRRDYPTDLNLSTFTYEEGRTTVPAPTTGFRLGWTF